MDSTNGDYEWSSESDKASQAEDWEKNVLKRHQHLESNLHDVCYNNNQWCSMVYRVLDQQRLF